VTGVDSRLWRDGLAELGDGAVTAVLTVQCGVGWLRAEARGLCDEIDSAIMALVLAREDVAVDRIVLHSVPVLGGVPVGEQEVLNAAHADWLYRLAAAAALLPAARRPRVHRVIIRGSQRSVDLVEGIGLRRDGTWSPPEVAAAAWEVLGRAGAATPLTSYDIDMDGPFGDADPSVYL